MCTAATYKTKDFYMGRTLDNEFSYGEQITITPRNYEFGAIKRIVDTHNAEEEVEAKKKKREPIMLPRFSCHGRVIIRTS